MWVADRFPALLSDARNQLVLVGGLGIPKKVRERDLVGAFVQLSASFSLLGV